MAPASQSSVVVHILKRRSNSGLCRNHVEIQCLFLLFIVKNTPNNNSVMRFQGLEKGLQAFLPLRNTFWGAKLVQIRRDKLTAFKLMYVGGSQKLQILQT